MDFHAHAKHTIFAGCGQILQFLHGPQIVCQQFWNTYWS